MTEWDSVATIIVSGLIVLALLAKIVNLDERVEKLEKNHD